MTDGQLTIIVAAIGSALASLASLRQSRINGKKVDVVHDLANGSITAIKTELIAANSKIAVLEAVVQRLIEKDGQSK